MKQYWSLELQTCRNAPPDQVCKLVDDYDKNVVPGNLPIILNPFVDIQEVVEIDTFKGTMTVLLTIGAYWSDPNLSYKPETMLVQLNIFIYILLFSFNLLLIIGKLDTFH